MKKPLIIKLIVIFIFIVSSAGAGWYFWMYEKDPGKVLFRMQMAMSEPSSYHSEAALEASVDVGDLINTAAENAGGIVALFIPKTSVFSISFLTDADLTFDENKLSENYQTKTDIYFAAKDTGSALFDVSVENRLVDKMSYFKLNDVNVAFFPLDLSSVTETWYQIDDMKRFADLESRKADITGVFSEDDYQDKMMRVRDLFQKTDLLTHVETLADESIDNVPTYHYRVRLNTETISAFVDEFLVIMNIEQTETVQPIMDTIVTYLKDVDGEVWIGKKDFYLYKSAFTTSFSYAPEDYADESIHVDLSLVMKNSKFNEPIEIVAPENARDSSKFLQSIIGAAPGGFMGDGLPSSGARDTNMFVPENEITFPEEYGERLIPSDADIDGDGLSDTQERFWGSNPMNPDTDGDGYIDGAEVDAGYSPTGSGKLF